MDDDAPPSSRDGARDQIGEMLRTALPAADEAPLDDATRRLMLQLSIEPLDGLAQTEKAPVPPRRSFLHRMLHPQANTAR